ncbi:MAG: DUF6252 family protein [Pseudobacter sp.]|uniref:DUF6252 family protein n=1 Tax=Pseudobacter sp. TaxID=2045420 RepID=UPI003F7FB3FD
MSRFLRFCLPVLMVLGLASCLKEKSVDSTEDGGTGILRMKIDGKQWTANKAVSAVVTNDLVVITGVSQDDITLVIQLETATTGTFQLDQASTHVATVLDINEASPVAYTTNQGANSSIAGGTVNITSIENATKRISGNFSMKVYRATDDKTLMITEGFFENLTYTTTTPNPGGSNTLTMKVDGGDFTGTSVDGNEALGMIVITAQDAGGIKGVTLGFPATITQGTYTLDNANFYTAFYQNATLVYGAGAGGSLTITQHDVANRTVKGTFSFTGEDQSTPPGPDVAVTSGSFSVTY